MAENNNALTGKLPETPNTALKTLKPLAGKWKLTGDDLDGDVRQVNKIDNTYTSR